MKNQVKLKRMTESKKLRNVLTGEKKANEKKKFRQTYFFLLRELILTYLTPLYLAFMTMEVEGGRTNLKFVFVQRLKSKDSSNFLHRKAFNADLLFHFTLLYLQYYKIGIL